MDQVTKEMVAPGGERSEIAFFDLETTIPTPPGQEYAILEFGSMLVCPRKLTILHTYQTLVKPLDISLITPRSVRANGITADHLVSSPSFSDIADKVFDILNGRVWAGHNIRMFDCERLKEAYAQIDRPPPVAKGTIDTWRVLAQRFGRRAGDMKMASLASYFGLRPQSHRSMDDVRMNLEVVKLCATVLFLEESSQQDISTRNNQASLNATTMYPCNGKRTLEGMGSNISPFPSTRNIKTHTSHPNHVTESNIHQNPVESGSAQPDLFHTGPSVDKIESVTLQSNEAMVVEVSSTSTPSNAFSTHTDFIDLDGVSLASITLTIAPFLHGSNRIQILHRDVPLQIRCVGMRIRFGLSPQFVDSVGRPRLSFVVDANSSNLCNILDACDNIVKRIMESDSNTEWRPVVSRKPGFYNSPTIRLHLPTAAEDTTRWITEIYHKNSSSMSLAEQLVSSKYDDVEEVVLMLRPGSLVDAYFSLEPYNYQQNAGIRLVAKKLIVYDG